MYFDPLKLSNLARNTYAEQVYRTLGDVAIYIATIHKKKHVELIEI